MNPDHADEQDQCDDITRAVEHALRKHDAMDYDRLYEMWFRQTCRESETNEEIWRLRAEVYDERSRAEKAEAAIEQFLAAYPWGPWAREIEGLRAALEGKP
jgi:hypothetical protein